MEKLNESLNYVGSFHDVRGTAPEGLEHTLGSHSDWFYGGKIWGKSGFNADEPLLKAEPSLPGMTRAVYRDDDLCQEIVRFKGKS